LISQRRLGPIKVLVEMPTTLWWFGIDPRRNRPVICLDVQVNCSGIGRNSDDWMVVSVSALSGATATEKFVHIGQIYKP